MLIFFFFLIALGGISLTLLPLLVLLMVLTCVQQVVCKSGTAGCMYKLMTCFHTLCHLAFRIFGWQWLLNPPRWFVHLEWFCILVSIFLIFYKCGFIKGLFGVFLFPITYLTVNIIIEMFFTDGMWIPATVIAIIMYFVVFKLMPKVRKRN